MFDLFQTIIINKKLGIPSSIVDIIGKYYITNPFYLNINDHIDDDHIDEHISSNGKLYYCKGCFVYNDIITSISIYKKDFTLTSIECNDKYLFIGELCCHYNGRKEYFIRRYEIENIYKNTLAYNSISIQTSPNDLYKKFHLCNDKLIYNGIAIDCNTLEKISYVLYSYKTDKYYFVQKDKCIEKYDLNDNLIKQYPIKNNAIKFYEKNDIVYCFDGTTLICLN